LRLCPLGAAGGEALRHLKSASRVPATWKIGQDAFSGGRSMRFGTNYFRHDDYFQVG
jgi:hypothetical protein